ncbi:hypothetical protein, partial [Variovorax rhizosphaerae]
TLDTRPNASSQARDNDIPSDRPWGTLHEDEHHVPLRRIQYWRAIHFIALNLSAVDVSADLRPALLITMRLSNTSRLQQLLEPLEDEELGGRRK